MTIESKPAPVHEMAGEIGAAEFEAVRRAGRPAVLRGLCREWPAVQAALESDQSISRYLIRDGVSRPVAAIAAAPSENGRFFYNDDLSRLNFVKGSGRLESFLSDLLNAANIDSPPAMAVQSEDITSLLPSFVSENQLKILQGIPPRIWIGNRIRVAPHYDVKENVACCVAGLRRFTVFPPDQIANLYPGPFELTPAGTPVSLVDISSPDLSAHPRFGQAWENAQQATLEPGDAIYIPYGWWHGVESLSALNILVNYWWSAGLPEGIGGPYDALLHAILSFKHLPKEQRDVWRLMLEHYVFENDGDPASHIPANAKGILGAPSPTLFEQMRDMIRQAIR